MIKTTILFKKVYSKIYRLVIFLRGINISQEPSFQFIFAWGFTCEKMAKIQKNTNKFRLVNVLFITIVIRLEIFW